MHRTCFGCGCDLNGNTVNLRLVNTTTKREITLVVCRKCAKKAKEATEEPWSVS